MIANEYYVCVYIYIYIYNSKNATSKQMLFE